MTLMHIPLKNIIIKDLKSLIEEETSESLFLEYKAITYSKEDKEEFLKDISSFANSQGGDIIIGISEKDGKPKEFLPFVGLIDAEKRRLGQMAQSGLEPQIFNLQIQEVSYGEGNIIIIRIPRSYNLPHRIKTNKKFHVRANSHIYEPDIITLRHMFNSTLLLEEQIKEWRDKRVNKIISKRTPVRLGDYDEPILAIHLIPYSFNDSSMRANFNKIQDNKEYFVPQYHRDTDSTSASDYSERSFYNFDGYLFHSYSDDSINGKKIQQRAYNQIFRSCAIESVNRGISSEKRQGILDSLSIKGIISMSKIQDLITTCSWYYILGLSKSDITTPVVMSVSLLNIKDYAIGTDFDPKSFEGVIIQEEEILVFTEIILENLFINKEEYEKLIKPLLDHLANTIGLKCANNLIQWSSLVGAKNL